MTTEILLPGLGESIFEGTIVRWLKEPGDRVERDEDLVLVSTDKIETELPSPYAGTLVRVLAEVGDTVEVGAAIAVLDRAAAGRETETESSGESEDPGQGESGNPGEGEGETASQRENANASQRPNANASQRALGHPTAAPSAVAPATGTGPDEGRARGGKLFLSPVVRRLVRENDIDLTRVPGTGREGRVTRRDVEAFVAAGGAGTGFVAPPGGYTPGLRLPVGGFAATVAAPFDLATPPRYAPEQFEGDVVEPLSPLGRAMAEHMAWTWWRAPHVSTIVEVDMSRVAAARRAGPKYSYTLMIAHAVARSLREHPSFNSSLTGDHRRVTHRDVNLGVAVAKRDGGLVVPVLHGAGELSLEQLAGAFEQRVQQAREGRLKMDDLRGGTFTITNVGSNGNLASMPLINQPQVAILAVGAITKRVVVVTDEHGADAMAIRPMMYVTLTYDHRANDGAASGRFLRAIRQRLEGWGE